MNAVEVITRGRLSSFIPGAVVRLPDGRLAAVFNNPGRNGAVQLMPGKGPVFALPAKTQVEQVATGWEIFREWIQQHEAPPDLEIRLEVDHVGATIEVD